MVHEPHTTGLLRFCNFSSVLRTNPARIRSLAMPKSHRHQNRPRQSHRLQIHPRAYRRSGGHQPSHRAREVPSHPRGLIDQQPEVAGRTSVVRNLGDPAGTPLAGTPLAGTPLAGTPLAGIPLAGIRHPGIAAFGQDILEGVPHTWQHAPVDGRDVPAAVRHCLVSKARADDWIKETSCSRRRFAASLSSLVPMALSLSLPRKPRFSGALPFSFTLGRETDGTGGGLGDP
jgi:hypothetical protein